MGIFKYKLGLSYLQKDQDPITIDPANISGFAIDYDYSVVIDHGDNGPSIMPNIIVTCKLDKNLADKIIEGQKDNYLRLVVGKINVSTNEQIAEPYIDAICYYKITGDKNYNKDKDYHEGSNPDVYTDVMIGLASKELIERNKQLINCTLKDTDMMNAILQLTNGMPLLIEPFKYNKKIDQLVVPPQESINKALKFLNDIAVFYDTPYRFYMDFKAAYLLSSSGKAVPMVGEDYSSVHIQVRNPVDYNANELGVDLDDKSKCYVVPVNANNTNYNVDTDTDKEFNKIIGIIDPSRKNSLPSVMGDAIASANTIVSSIKGAVEAAKSVVIDGVNQINSSYNEVKYQNKVLDGVTGSFTGVHGTAISTLDGIIKQYEDTASKDALSRLKLYREKLIGNHEGCLGGKSSMNNNVIDFDKFKCNTQTIGYNITSVTSYTNGIKVGNIPSNVDGIVGLTGSNANDVANNLLFAGDITKNVNKAANDMLGGMGNYRDLLGGMDDIVESTKTASDGTNNNTEDITIDLKPMRDLAPKAAECFDAAKPSLETVMDKVSKSGVVSNRFKGLNTDLANNTNQLKDIKTDLKNQLTNISNSWKETQNNIKTQIEKMKALKSVGISDLAQLKNIGSISDLSSVGRLGVTNVETMLGLPHNEDSSAKAKMVVLNNDDPNKIKNIQSHLELQGVLFTISKLNMDNSIFTINKEYTVSNVEQRKDKDGKLLLIGKKELYKREDNLFSCNTILSFNRLPDKK